MRMGSLDSSDSDLSRPPLTLGPGPWVKLLRLTPKEINAIRVSPSSFCGNVDQVESDDNYSSSSNSRGRPTRRVAQVSYVYKYDDDDDDGNWKNARKKKKIMNDTTSSYGLQVMSESDPRYKKGQCHLCKLESKEELLSCWTCNWLYHMICLSPLLKKKPEDDVDDDDLSEVPCPRCTCEPFKDDEKPQRILSWRFVNVDDKVKKGSKQDDDDTLLKTRRQSKMEPKKKNEGPLLREFFVYFANRSYWDCIWVPELKLAVYSPNLLNFYSRKNDMTQPPNCELDEQELSLMKIEPNDPLFDKYYKYGVRPDWLTIHRVVTHTVNSDESVTYLIKWRGLSYGQATWEDQSKMSEMVPGFQYEAAIYLERRIAGLTGRRRENKVDFNFKYLELPPDEPATDLAIMFEEQPDFVDTESGLALHPYQLDGLSWLRHSWSERRNTILADEMGLGKTIQAITFLYGLYMEGHSRGPFLVCAPLSTIINWEREFETWAPQFYVVTYTGDRNTRSIIRQYELSYDESQVKRGQQVRRLKGNVKFHVLLTSYELAMLDAACLASVRYKILVIDEGHKMRDSEAKFFKCMNAYQTRYKLVLTGTPLQNSLTELFHLLNFLIPDKFYDLRSFQLEFTDSSKKEQIEKLQSMLGPHLRRRIKADVLKDLPSKSEVIVGVSLSPMQRKYYKYILTKNFSGLNSDNGGKATSLLNLMMDLRKCCNHPYFFSTAQDVAPLTDNRMYEVNALTQASGKLILLQKMLRMLKQDGHRVLIFSQMTKMLDLLEDFLHGEGYLYERLDGSNSGQLRQDAIDRFNAPGAEQFVFLISTRAGGLGINLASADTVIVFDSDWNPHNDIQAFSRAHRIGQANKVMIYRLITRNSVEEKIASVAKKKLMLTHLVVRPGMGDRGNASFSKYELQDIIRFGTEELFKDDDDTLGGQDGSSSCYSDEAIRELLDRTKQGPADEKEDYLDEYFSSFKVVNVIKNASSGGRKEVKKRVEVDIDNDDSSAENINPLYWQKWLGQLQQLGEQANFLRPTSQKSNNMSARTNGARRGRKVVSYVSRKDSEVEKDTKQGVKRVSNSNKLKLSSNTRQANSSSNRGGRVNRR